MTPLKPPPLGIYVHLPWCVRKCPYCDFNSHTRRPGKIPEQSYISALLQDLERDLAQLPLSDREVSSIFIGGGTPSLFSPDSIAVLLEGISNRLKIEDDVEITLEANPGAADADRFRGFRQAGVNRLSIGIQSFDDRHLARLGRIHDRQDAFKAIEAAHATGFESFNLDLMYALPEQTVAEAVTDVKLACELGDGHLSHYQLTLEPGTVFAQYPPNLPDDDTAWQMHQQSLEVIAAAGLARYEISAYARPGTRCRHNLNYWEFGDYLGLGAGAHGKVTDITGDTIVRTTKPSSPQTYLRSIADGDCAVTTFVAPSERPIEFFMNALRLIDGTTLALFSQRTGLAASAAASGLSRARELGLLITNGTHIAPTKLGLRYLNELLVQFMPTDSTGH
ncbi:MAG: radical SAM family heme chaperone HemW [Pseudomonadota bacterium]|nr:radical SAM family heme chaperone HemW [Pseudomonadota bacterium]